MGNCSALCGNPDVKETGKVDENEARPVQGGGKSSEPRKNDNVRSAYNDQAGNNRRMDGETSDYATRNEPPQSNYHHSEGKNSAGDYNANANVNSQSAQLIQSTIGKKERV